MAAELTLIRPDPPPETKPSAASWGGGAQPSGAISGYWTPARMRAALDNNDAGYFAGIVALRSYLTRDARVGGQGGARGQRISAPMGLDARLELPEAYESTDRRSPAQRVLDAAKPILESGAFGPLVRAHLEGELADFGVGYGVISWQPSGGGGGWTPVFTPWALDATRVDSITGQIFATFADGTEEPITPGDGRWIAIQASLVRPWEMGAIRCIATPVLERCYARRDASRASEAAGQSPVISGVPRDASPTERAAFETAAQGITTGKQGMVKGEGYTVERLWSKGDIADVFFRIAEIGSSDVAIGYLGTDGTMEKGKVGTFGAVAVLDGVRYDLVEADCGAHRATWLQISEPFAVYNFGRVDLAPRLDIDVPDPEEDAHEAAEHEATRKARAAFLTEIASAKQLGPLTIEVVTEIAAAHDVDVSPGYAALLAGASTSPLTSVP